MQILNALTLGRPSRADDDAVVHGGGENAAEFGLAMAAPDAGDAMPFGAAHSDPAAVGELPVERVALKGGDRLSVPGVWRPVAGEGGPDLPDTAPKGGGQVPAPGQPELWLTDRRDVETDLVAMGRPAVVDADAGGAHASDVAAGTKTGAQGRRADDARPLAPRSPEVNAEEPKPASGEVARAISDRAFVSGDDPARTPMPLPERRAHLAGQAATSDAGLPREPAPREIEPARPRSDNPLSREGVARPITSQASDTLPPPISRASLNQPQVPLGTALEGGEPGRAQASETARGPVSERGEAVGRPLPEKAPVPGLPLPPVAPVVRPDEAPMAEAEEMTAPPRSRDLDWTAPAAAPRTAPQASAGPMVPPHVAIRREVASAESARRDDAARGDFGVVRARALPPEAAAIVSSTPAVTAPGRVATPAPVRGAFAPVSRIEDRAAWLGDMTLGAGDEEAEPFGLPAPASHDSALRLPGLPDIRPPSVVRAVILQISEAIRAAPEGAIEVSLSPEELGRVKLTLMPGDAGLVVHMVAERSETLDLLRRHADMLAADLRDAGYSGLEFSFGRDDRGQDGGGGGDTGPARPGRPDISAALAATDMARQRPSPALPAGALDIRL